MASNIPPIAKIEDGGPAFPHTSSGDRSMSALRDHRGMTLRDLFAMNAMIAAGQFTVSDNESLEEVIARVADRSYMVANAMIARRNKE